MALAGRKKKQYFEQILWSSAIRYEYKLTPRAAKFGEHFQQRPV